MSATNVNAIETSLERDFFGERETPMELYGRPSVTESQRDRDQATGEQYAREVTDYLYGVETAQAPTNPEPAGSINFREVPMNIQEVPSGIRASLENVQLDHIEPQPTNEQKDSFIDLGNIAKVGGEKAASGLISITKNTFKRGIQFVGALYSGITELINQYILGQTPKEPSTPEEIQAQRAEVMRVQQAQQQTQAEVARVQQENAATERSRVAGSNLSDAQIQEMRGLTGQAGEVGVHDLMEVAAIINAQQQQTEQMQQAQGAVSPDAVTYNQFAGEGNSRVTGASAGQ